MIYHRATRVIIWLGVAHKYTDDAVRCFKVAEKYCGEPDSRNFKLARHPAWVRAFKVLLRNPYWERIWVMQEMILASELAIHWGTRTIEWSAFMRLAMQAVRTVDSNKWYINTVLVRLENIATIGRGENQEFYGMGLRLAIDSFCDNKCKDPRDHFYGLMGIVRTQDRVEPDFKLPVEDVYMLAVNALALEKQEKLEDRYDVHKLLVICAKLMLVMLPNIPVRILDEGKEVWMSSPSLAEKRIWRAALLEGQGAVWVVQHVRSCLDRNFPAAGC
jgi:hypothetical protein